MLNITNDIAVISIDDGKANTFDTERLEMLRDAFSHGAKNAQAIILTGREGMFSAGLNLNIVRSGEPMALKGLLEASQGCLRQILRTPIPVVAASAGHAMALGAVLLMACDYRIGAVGDWRIGVNATANGVLLSDDLIALLKNRLNRRYAYRSILCAEVFDPESAVHAGYYDECVASSAILESATEKAANLAALPKDVFAAHKKALWSPVFQAFGD